MSSFEHITIPALKDGFALHATRFDPPKDSPVRACVVIHCATGLDAKFYRAFALWLADQRIGVLTYDYRYTGLSWPSDQLGLVIGPNATEETRTKALQAAPEDLSIIGHWFLRDAAAAIRYAAKRWPGVPLTCLGHSMGGIFLPVIFDERPLISRYGIVCGGNKWIGNYEDPLMVLEALKEHLYLPLEKDRIFYGTRTGLGNDLPYGIGKEWLADTLHPRGVQRHDWVEKITRELQSPVLAIGFEDDGLAFKASMHQMMAQFSHSSRSKYSLWIDPSAHNPPWPACEHVKSFLPTRPHSSSSSSPPSSASEEPVPLTRQETIWPIYRDWILHGQVQDTSVGEYKTWQPEDEFDPLERAEFEYSLEEGKEMVRRRAKAGAKL